MKENLDPVIGSVFSMSIKMLIIFFTLSLIQQCIDSYEKIGIIIPRHIPSFLWFVFTILMLVAFLDTTLEEYRNKKK